MALDLHIHDTDYVQYLFGMPKAVCSAGGKGPDGGLMHISTQYLYDNGTAITAEGGWGMMPAFGFEMSFNLVLEKATLVYDLTRDPVFRLCPAKGEAFTPEVAEGDGWFLQINHFAKAVSGKKVEEITTLEQSMNSVRIVEAEKESANTGQKVSID
jgi:predicted dehydrogenase